jgi:hypothetical protein
MLTLKNLEIWRVASILELQATLKDRQCDHKPTDKRLTHI